MTEMNRVSCMLSTLWLLVICGPIYAEDWGSKLDAQAKASRFVVVGRLARMNSHTRLDGTTVSIGKIQVRKHLKGASDLKFFDCEFPFKLDDSVSADTEEYIWFVHDKLPSGRFGVEGTRAPADYLALIRDKISRINKKKTPMPGLPKPRSDSAPVSVVLAFDNGTETAATSIRVAAGTQVTLIAQFENHDSAEHAVMPCLDASDVFWRYPHYRIEVRDATGKAVTRHGVSMCGNVDPLRARDIILLQTGEIFRTRFEHYMLDGFPPGSYRARLKYTAKQDQTAKGISPMPDDPDLLERIKTVWQGTIESNWIDIQVTAPNAATQPARAANR